MQGGLAKGLKFGVIASSDNHDSKPARSQSIGYPCGLAAAWATALTRESIWNANWNYSTYGTSIDRIYVDFSLNGEPMGSTVSAGNQIDIRAYVIGKTDGITVDLVRDNENIETYLSTNGVVDIQFQERPENVGHYYYLRVTQDNGEQAWSTPIWVN